jgi:hypothetical protein
MRSLVASAGIAALLAGSACTMTRSSRTSTIGLGAAAGMVGATMVAVGPTEVDSDRDGANEWAFNDDYTVPLVGTLLLVVGLGILASGLAATVPPEQPVGAPIGPVVYGTAAPGLQPVVMAPIAPPSAHDPGQLLVDQILQLVDAGHCEPARPLIAKLYIRAPMDHRVLIAGPLLDRCPELR